MTDLVYRACAYMQTRFHREDGASAVEYGLLVALIALVIVFIVLALGQTLSSVFSKTNSGISTGVAGGSS